MGLLLHENLDGPDLVIAHLRVVFSPVLARGGLVLLKNASGLVGLHVQLDVHLPPVELLQYLQLDASHRFQRLLVGLAVLVVEQVLVVGRRQERETVAIVVYTKYDYTVVLVMASLALVGCTIGDKARGDVRPLVRIFKWPFVRSIEEKSRGLVFLPIYC